MADPKILIIGTDSSGSGGTDISHLVSYKVLYPKLWSSDSGRNMAGDNKATLVGVFTKLQVEIMPNKLTARTLTSILNVLNSASVYCKYFDVQTQSLKTESFYFGDIETALLNANTNKTIISQFSIIGNKRRTV
jgi:hypothetical protein